MEINCFWYEINEISLIADDENNLIIVCLT